MLVPTAYTYNSYLAPSHTAVRLTRFTRAEIEADSRVPHVNEVFPIPRNKRKKAKTSLKKVTTTRIAPTTKPKGKQTTLRELSDLDITPPPTTPEIKPLDLPSDDGKYSIDDESLSDRVTGSRLTGDSSRTSGFSDTIVPDSEDEELADWETSIRRPLAGGKHKRSEKPSTRPAKRRKVDKGKSRARSPPQEVIELSSD